MKITTALEILGANAGLGASTLLQLFDENGAMIADAITISRGRIPREGEKVTRLVEDKAKVFVVFGGFHYLVGTTLIEVVNAKRTQDSFTGDSAKA